MEKEKAAVRKKMNAKAKATAQKEAALKAAILEKET
jgi:hypothetical protein